MSEQWWGEDSVATSVQTMPVAAQMGQTSYPPGEGQVLAHIRRIASIFTMRNKCRNKDCPSNKHGIPDIPAISSQEEKVSTGLVAAKKSLTRRKSCPAGPSQYNVLTSRHAWTKVGNIVLWCQQSSDSVTE